MTGPVPRPASLYAQHISPTSRSAGGDADSGRVERRVGFEQAETDLVNSARAGHRPALEQLLRDHYDGVYRVCRRVLDSDQDALDAAQEAMIAIARGITRFDGRSRFSTWVYRIAMNAALDEARRRSRRPVLHAVAETDSPDVSGRDVAADVVGEQIAARVTLERALGGLPEDQRVAVVLRDIEGLDYAEISAVLQIPIGTVRSRIARGRIAIAVAIGEPRPDTVTHSQRNLIDSKAVEHPRHVP